MKLLAFLLLLSGLTAGGPPQQTPPPQQAGPQPDLSVVKLSWRKERLPGWENGFGRPNFETYDEMRARVDNERRIQLARNSGNKGEQSRREGAAKMLEDATNPKGEEKGERPRDGYRYKVVVRNDGPKTVKLVDWDYLFLDPQTGAELGRRQFTSEEKVRPGKEKSLEVFILSPPFLTVDAGAAKEVRPAEQVVIVRVEYEDGSVWQRP